MDYCPEKLKPGGCQLHNLHCGYPACNTPKPPRDMPTPPQAPEEVVQRVMNAAKMSAGHLESALRAALATQSEAVEVLVEACANARDILATDRDGFVDCHQVHDSRVEDAIAHGLVWVSDGVWIPSDVAEPLREYDRAIELIDRATALAAKGKV